MWVRLLFYESRVYMMFLALFLLLVAVRMLKLAPDPLLPRKAEPENGDVRRWRKLWARSRGWWVGPDITFTAGWSTFFFAAGVCGSLLSGAWVGLLGEPILVWVRWGCILPLS